MKKIAIVLGTRPEIIKLAELIRLLKEHHEAKTVIAFTGQHYDYNLCQIFMEELELPKIDINLGISGGGNEKQVTLMEKKLGEFFLKEKPEIVIAEGDTNSVLAAALAAKDIGTKFAHVEAGLRSFDERMPEEKNRIEADKLADYAFAPTDIAVKHLQDDKIEEAKIFLTGNTIVEAVQKNLEKAKDSKILETLGLTPEKYAVLTAHRQEYVDKKENLEELLSAIAEIDIKVVFPAHPRTLKNLTAFNLLKKAKAIPNLQFIEPAGYFDFLKLASNAMFLLSDSGGIQEEASVYKKWIVILRDNTERPEILEKFGRLTGYCKEKIVEESKKAMENYPELKKRLEKEPCPFGDGKTSQKIVEIILRE